jgi:hypothetical protein
MFDHVLDLFDGGHGVTAELILENEGDDIRNRFGLGIIVDALGFHRLEDRFGDFVLSKIDYFTIALLDSGDDS